MSEGSWADGRYSSRRVWSSCRRRPKAIRSAVQCRSRTWLHIRARCCHSSFLSSRLELVQKGRIEERLFWLWAFYGDDGHRWNLIVFSEPSDRAASGTWMCADSSHFGFNDHEYIVAIHNEDY